MTEECTLEFGPDGIARLAGALTFDTCARLHRAMEKGLSEGRSPERIDLAGVTAADSAGLALLLEWRSGSEGLRMSGAPDSLLKLARLCNAADLLEPSGRHA